MVSQCQTFYQKSCAIGFNADYAVFYLYLLSAAFASTSVTNPVHYVLAGIVIIVVFQTSLNIATSTIEDIVSGYMKEVLVSPVKRIQIAAGQMLASATIATFKGL